MIAYLEDFYKVLDGSEGHEAYPRYLRQDAKIKKVAFVSHLVDEDQLDQFDRFFESWDLEKRRIFLKDFEGMTKPIVYHRQRIENAQGESVEALFVGMAESSKFFEKCIREGRAEAFQLVEEAVALARKEGAEKIGLGQYSSIVTVNGELLDCDDCEFTTGNTLTVGLAWPDSSSRTLMALSRSGLSISQLAPRSLPTGSLVEIHFLAGWIRFCPESNQGIGIW